MPPKKPPVATAAPKPGESAGPLLEKKFPVWNETAIATEPFDQPFEDPDVLPLPPALATLAVSMQRFQECTGASSLVIVHAPDIPKPQAEPAPAPGKGKPAAPAAKPKPGAAAPAAPVAPRVAMSGFDRRSGQSALFAGLISVFEFVDSLREKIAPGQLLWELISPKDMATGLPAVSVGGRYAVKLFVAGAWRSVIVDDRVPVSASGEPLLPTTPHNELWPVLLSKALLKALGPSAALAHASAVTALTGLWPNVASVGDDVFAVCEQAAASRATVLLDPPGAPSQQLQSARTAAALPLQSLYVPLRAADVSWEAREHYRLVPMQARVVQLRNRAAKFGGRFSDADVKMWSREFEEALGVELHVRQKQKPSDFFIAAEDAAALFDTQCTYITPAGSAEQIVVSSREDSALPQLLVVDVASSCTLSVLVTALGGDRDATVSLSPYSWQQPRNAPLLTVQASPISMGEFILPTGKHVLRLSGDTSSAEFVVVHIKCTDAVTIGPLDDIVVSHCGVVVANAEGDVPSQTGYHLLTRQKLTVDQQAVCDIDLNIADAAVAAQTTLTILTPQQEPLPFAGLKLAQRTFSPGVYTVLACTTLQAAAAAPTRWQLSVRSNPAVKLENVAMPGKFPAEGTVQGLSVGSLLCRYAIQSKAEATALLRVCCTPNTVPLTVEFQRQRKTVRQGDGVGCVVLPLIELEAEAVAEAPKKPAGKEAVTIPDVPKYANVVLVRVADFAADSESALPESVKWEMSVIASADAKVIALKPDDQHDIAMTAVKLGWEKAAPGRAAKAKLSRETFAKADYGTEGPPPAVTELTPGSSETETDHASAPAETAVQLLTSELISERAADTAQRTAAFTEKKAVIAASRTEEQAARVAFVSNETDKATQAYTDTAALFATEAGWRAEFNTKHYPPPPEAEPVGKGKKPTDTKKK